MERGDENLGLGHVRAISILKPSVHSDDRTGQRIVAVRVLLTFRGIPAVLIVQPRRYKHKRKKNKHNNNERRGEEVNALALLASISTGAIEIALWEEYWNELHAAMCIDDCIDRMVGRIDGWMDGWMDG